MKYVDSYEIFYNVIKMSTSQSGSSEQIMRLDDLFDVRGFSNKSGPKMFGLERKTTFGDYEPGDIEDLINSTVMPVSSSFFQSNKTSQTLNTTGGFQAEAMENVVISKGSSIQKVDNTTVSLQPGDYLCLYSVTAVYNGIIEFRYTVSGLSYGNEFFAAPIDSASTSSSGNMIQSLFSTPIVANLKILGTLFTSSALIQRQTLTIIQITDYNAIKGPPGPQGPQGPVGINDNFLYSKNGIFTNPILVNTEVDLTSSLGALSSTDINSLIFYDSINEVFKCDPLTTDFYHFLITLRISGNYSSNSNSEYTYELRRSDGVTVITSWQYLRFSNDPLIQTTAVILSTRVFPGGNDPFQIDGFKIFVKRLSGPTFTFDNVNNQSLIFDGK